MTLINVQSYFDTLLNKTTKIVICSHCILITSSRNIKSWEKSATDEAIGMPRGNFKKRRTRQPPPGEVGGSRKAKEFPENRPLKGHDLNETAEFK